LTHTHTYAYTINAFVHLYISTYVSIHRWCAPIVLDIPFSDPVQRCPFKRQLSREGRGGERGRHRGEGRGGERGGGREAGEGGSRRGGREGRGRGRELRDDRGVGGWRGRRGMGGGRDTERQDLEKEGLAERWIKRFTGDFVSESRQRDILFKAQVYICVYMCVYV